MLQSNPLPIIDISAFADTKSSREERIRVGKLVDDACRNWGFFYLSGHGLSVDEMTAIRTTALQFFNCSQEEKEEISIQKTDYARGYQRLGQNITQYASDW